MTIAALKGKKIILGITGSIAAYKSAVLTRLLIKAGAEVQILMTGSATDFITPLTLSTLSKHAVITDVHSESSWNNHVDLGLWADAYIIAPATANTLAKLAHGICDNMVSAVYLSARCPVFVAPAMDLDMWKHPTTVNNVRLLKSYGNHLIPVENGELASGLTGDGRMAEPENILSFLGQFFSNQMDMAGKKVVITAGPTYEPIDPVRYIGNRSSGKMGIALAEEAAGRGAEVTLVLGPSRLSPTNPAIQVLPVRTADDMLAAVQTCFEQADITILSAAVADYKPHHYSPEKIKKKSDDMVIALEKTPDIAATLGAVKRPDQLLIGFALETNDELENAKLKLHKKNFDFIVLNSLQDEGAGFNHDTNKISIIFRDLTVKAFELKSKTAVARDIMDAIIEIK